MKSTPSNDLVRKYLVEDCKKININTVLRQVRGGILMSLIHGVAEVDGLEVEITSKKLHHGGDRLWFVCPLCKRTVGILYRHPLKNNLVGCRLCLDLEYRCRMSKNISF